MAPKTSLGITATEFGNPLPSSGLAANQTAATPPNNEGRREPRDEDCCQWKLSERSYLAQSDRTVICDERWLSAYILLRRVREDGDCFDEIVDTRTEEILSRRPAPCTCPD